MVTFNMKRQMEIDQIYQGIHVSEFTFEVAGATGNDQIFDAFIQSKHFTFESLRAKQKDPSNSYLLRRAFDFEQVHFSDFKKIDKQQTTKFLVDFLNEPDWGDDRNEFAALLDRYFEIHRDFGNDDFYVISKDWFDKGDKKLFGPENLIYTYYMLIVVISVASNRLIMTEWTYD